MTIGNIFLMLVGVNFWINSCVSATVLSSGIKTKIGAARGIIETTKGLKPAQKLDQKTGIQQAVQNFLLEQFKENGLRGVIAVVGVLAQRGILPSIQENLQQSNNVSSLTTWSPPVTIRRSPPIVTSFLYPTLFRR